MKKLLSIIMLSTLLTSIASCGKSENNKISVTPTVTPTIRTTEAPMSIEEYSYIFSIGAKDAEGIKDCTYEYDKKSNTVKFVISIDGMHDYYEKLMNGESTKEDWEETIRIWNDTTKEAQKNFTEDGYNVSIEMTVVDEVENFPIFSGNNGETTYDIISLIKDKSGWNTPTPEPTVEPTEKPDTTVTLLKKNGITIKTDTDRLKYSSDINLEVKNNSGKDIIMRITDLSIDDEMADCYYRQTIKDGKKSTEGLKIYDSNFYEGSKIEFTVEVMNKNYHTLFTKTVKFTVPKDEEE